MVLVKTTTGQQVMKDRSVALSPRQRAAFILVDGRRSREELLRATQASGVTAEDLDHLAKLGLVEEVIPLASTAAPKPVDTRSPQDRYTDAYPIATSLTAGLGLRGFRLNLAIEAASSYEELLALAPRIKEAVGPEKFARLASALGSQSGA